MKSGFQIWDREEAREDEQKMRDPCAKRLQRKRHKKPSDMLKLSAVKVLPCVLMFSVTKQLEGFRKKVKRRFDYSLGLGSRTIPPSKCSIESLCLLIATFMLQNQRIF